VSLTVLEGSTFCISDERGDVSGLVDGFFASDTRFLSRFVLTVDGRAPLLLTSGVPSHFAGAFFLRNASSELSVRRDRVVGHGLQERVTVESNARRPLEVLLELDLAADFADIFAVKGLEFELGDPELVDRLPRATAPDRNGRSLSFRRDGYATHVVLSREPEGSGGTLRFPLRLEPGEAWELEVDVLPATSNGRVDPATVRARLESARSRATDALDRWLGRVPQAQCTWDTMGHAYRRSVSDLAALRMRSHPGALGELPAAGMPWFMTIFGRDVLVTCLQTQLLGPDLARAALFALAELQATEDDPRADAEPGKIVHELRAGRAAEAWMPRYYGSADATPLYLMLLGEVWRWTGDVSLARGLREPALRALAWIDGAGDPDGDGFVEYRRRSPVGILNQCWKDSDEAIVFRDGRRPKGAIAAAEIQGYVYAAKRDLAAIAREAWEDGEVAARLEREAADLRTRFDEAFWCDGYYALALDGDKRRVDALGSNIGQLLWAGIAEEARIDEVAERLMAPELWSGWGIRTLAAGQAAYNPLGYHTGTVWPHDNSLIAAGLARYGRWPEAHRVIRRMLEASSHFGYQLPEVFAGYDRASTPFPIAYPTATRPQAWASATPVLLLQVLLGLEPDPERRGLVTRASHVPAWAGRIELHGVRVFDRSFDVSLEDGTVAIIEP
jgi:glycogen debranching enzyme